MIKNKSSKFDFLTKERHNEAIDSIIAFFQDERGEKIGIIAAEEILDFFLQTIGDDVYKKAVGDVKKLLKERMDDLDIELDLLTEK
ncbi:MAG: hypothetical protein UY31_C0007G0004 [Candidatus Wolfebacteria bacterium GW2011_GWE1_48_7]|uniref:DUF2164 domain-containing protein n=2 Tax=Candidatus Wolfeibacteriota TaxID=1752735 RepID=A0A0G1U6W3_9BACT|nr:MAG: hypothetical protein UX70_C0001G0943 [Candidatus Wolfebacteria bacterium GW2011_GWB1_47_1]KKU36934.1 MAG: hypothetical protein UX49_C0005G0011 [Candidatus Wolfebacteria bacterium GW2011_GWC2_46_275]KKU42223.1 MAG: hypothetical protein UX58_C0003G0148 [Candidatus Wolfebacteria bacterium GW2011_GWB2_46_69]KKU53844.1 MAG: hypothetical protein UX76_C0009G0034 [Candidatus Wolfebacteria bacterium GW2011_GWC1_47_103]KKU59429.1 MAG: hypothetical protein UX83_C0005G0048 [Candidatus Wolfebacteria